MNSSGDYTVEYKFTADVKGLKEGVKEAGATLNDLSKSSTSVYYDLASSFDLMSVKAQAFFASVTALETVWVKQSLEDFASYEDAVYGMATTVGNVGGTIEQAMQSIQEVTANGLLSETDASKAINNLTSYGYTVAEATELIKALTLSSEAHRRSNMTVAEQVVQTTEGIRRQSSMMARASGNAETLSQAQERYAESLGKTASELTDAERKQAIFNSYIEAGNSSLAVAEGYENSYSASVQRMNSAMTDLKVAFGEAFAPLATVVANLATWIAKNKELVVVASTFVGVLLGAGGVAVALRTIIPLIQTAIVWFNGLAVSTKGVVLGLATVATTMAVIALTSNKTSKALTGVNSSTKKASTNMDNLASSVGGASGAVRDLSKELANLEKQYKDDLKQIELRHQETINKLTKQIQEANVDYRRAIDERNADFAVSQAKEERTHQEKVDELMTQIDFLQRYNNKYNQQKLTNLQLALQRENALYQKRTQAEKEELELQNAYDKASYEAKLASLQQELDEEMAFMNKHRADLQEVRDWILKDEIENLKDRYEAQKASYADQTASAGGAGYDIGENYFQGLDDAFNDYAGDINREYTTLADEIGESFESKLVSWVGNALAWVVEKITKVADWFAHFGENLNKAGKDLAKGIDNYFSTVQGIFQGIGDTARNLLGFSSGGYTGRGNPNEIAGVVHKGEYVLPQEMVDQSTGTPKSVGSTYNIYVSGVFATSATERRRVADQIVTAINQNNKSRLEASWQ